MKATGIVRKVDELGRVVLPKELRTVLDIEIKDPIEIYVDDEYIILKKYNPSCILCESMKDLENVNGKNICKKCIEEL
ncbi:AbrB/MazE/SpoVT family DNA-binding domain-containing protein [Clostridium aminobutyricum]|uniref:AbrB/MazE/SpoVT family DNA-binding domain-containing protein n=1 Tax=Clostridium aminobutyricum TaxID=33953 RepID=A0A939D6P2_CLOAM|nr:AbrB/MazE/SpoVT family DNA-binding domain-containing protein [Clostridium aminobutyricum]MBN7771833.1 AbrB/MazE/SpoVT family DNA-binding domain-containing protein [Clostridium aminobutyricum]